MKPLHGETMRLTRCPCCVPKKRRGPEGKKRSKHSARFSAKQEIRREIGKD